VLEPLAESDIAGRSSTKPDFATWPLTWLKLLTAPRGILKPADPRFTNNEDEARLETAGPLLPTTTVATVPPGRTGGWKRNGAFPA